MDLLFGVVILCAMVACVIGGAVYGTHQLMLELHVPEPYTWAIPLTVFFVFVCLGFRFAWRHLT
jgi:membrane-bound ClpP family serine protease